MNPIQVSHVTPYYDQAWAYGGIPRVVTDQAIALAARGVRVEVVTTDACGADARIARLDGGRASRPHPPTTRHGVEVRTFANLSNHLAYRWQFFLPRGMDRYLVDAARRSQVAHLHGLHNLPGVYGARRFKRAGRPYIVQPNGTAPRIERRRFAKLIFDTVLGRRVLRDAAALVAVTEVERSQLIAMGAEPATVSVIPNPVDVDLTPAPGADDDFRHRWQLGDEGTVLYLGQLSPRKRVDLLLRAVAALSATTRLVIAGSDMGCRKQLEELAARLGLAGRTVFTGVLEGEDRLAALAAADVVAYPTEDEIFGLVPLEALLCGTPVVVSDDCGCGEVIGRTGGGLVTSCGNVEALTDNLEQILRHPEAWRDPVSRAQQRIHELFSRDVVASQLHALYSKLLTP